jgi:hypothetical protein
MVDLIPGNINIQNSSEETLGMEILTVSGPDNFRENIAVTCFA